MKTFTIAASALLLSSAAALAQTDAATSEEPVEAPVAEADASQGAAETPVAETDAAASDQDAETPVADDATAKDGVDVTEDNAAAPAPGAVVVVAPVPAGGAEEGAISGEGAPLTLSDTFRADQVTGNSIYALREDVDATVWDDDGAVEDIQANYENIGSIDDLLLDSDGKLVGLLAEVGGFLGLGDKLVVLGLDEVRVVVAGDEAYYVTQAHREALENREPVDAAIWD